MLVLVGPPFHAEQQAYSQLAQATGLLPYDLRARIRPEGWGLLKALADRQEAEDLTHRVRVMGFRVALFPRAAGTDVARRIVTLRSLFVEGDQLRLQIEEREMVLPLASLLTLVFGEVRRARTHTARPSTSSLRPVSRSMPPNPAAASEPPDGYVALDLHFITVNWVARVDLRKTVFPGAVTLPAPALYLQDFSEVLAEAAGIPRDTFYRTSSVVSFARQMATDQPEFDVYSRLIAEAERSTRPRRLAGM